MSERLTDEQLDYLDHLAMKTRAKHGTMTTVLVSDLEVALAEIKERRAADLTAITVDVGGCKFGIASARAFAIDALAAGGRETDVTVMAKVLLAIIGGAQ